jgi:hypothetical protein
MLTNKNYLFSIFIIFAITIITGVIHFSNFQIFSLLPRSSFVCSAASSLASSFFVNLKMAAISFDALLITLVAFFIIMEKYVINSCLMNDSVIIILVTILCVFVLLGAFVIC